jgi:hypothetical protein
MTQTILNYLYFIIKVHHKHKHDYNYFARIRTRLDLKDYISIIRNRLLCWRIVY